MQKSILKILKIPLHILKRHLKLGEMNSIQSPNIPHHGVYTFPVILYFHELLQSKFITSLLNLQTSRVTHWCRDRVWCRTSCQTQKPSAAYSTVFVKLKAESPDFSDCVCRVICETKLKKWLFMMCKGTRRARYPLNTSIIHSSWIHDFCFKQQGICCERCPSNKNKARMLVPEGSLQAKKRQLAGPGSEQKVECSSTACLYTEKKSERSPQVQDIIPEMNWKLKKKKPKKKPHCFRKGSLGILKEERRTHRLYVAFPIRDGS